MKVHKGVGVLGKLWQDLVCLLLLLQALLLPLLLPLCWFLSLFLLPLLPMSPLPPPHAGLLRLQLSGGMACV